MRVAAFETELLSTDQRAWAVLGSAAGRGSVAAGAGAVASAAPACRPATASTAWRHVSLQGSNSTCVPTWTYSRTIGKSRTPPSPPWSAPPSDRGTGSHLFAKRKHGTPSSNRAYCASPGGGAPNVQICTEWPRPFSAPPTRIARAPPNEWPDSTTVRRGHFSSRSARRSATFDAILAKPPCTRAAHSSSPTRSAGKSESGSSRKATSCAALSGVAVPRKATCT
mmetsp:Transcript_6428/g.19090  ORF Transcript_6428/g.19090 Transcript_6428/m.19090 type:complete len:224 (+) Transcript_6428:3369-4040(+)